MGDGRNDVLPRRLWCHWTSCPPFLPSRAIGGMHAGPVQLDHFCVWDRRYGRDRGFSLKADVGLYCSIQWTLRDLESTASLVCAVHAPPSTSTGLHDGLDMPPFSQSGSLLVGSIISGPLPSRPPRRQAIKRLVSLVVTASAIGLGAAWLYNNGGILPSWAGSLRPPPPYTIVVGLKCTSLMGEIIADLGLALSKLANLAQQTASV